MLVATCSVRRRVMVGGRNCTGRQKRKAEAHRARAHPGVHPDPKCAVQACPLVIGAMCEVLRPLHGKSCVCWAPRGPTHESMRRDTPAMQQHMPLGECVNTRDSVPAWPC
jgi:hypothetical protein